jgi:hypothetical protein
VQRLEGNESQHTIRQGHWHRIPTQAVSIALAATSGRALAAAVASLTTRYINPNMLPRFDEIEEILLARGARAGHEAWLGEVEGIDLTLAFLWQKREETRRLTRIAPVDLGIPAFIPAGK